MQLARNDAQVWRFMTVPGVGAITALCFRATIVDPTRFKKSRSVGAYVGLTTRRYASGELDWTGRISKCGDAMLRSYLYEAANVLLTRRKVVDTQSLGNPVSEATWVAQGQGGGRPEACGHPAPDVGRRHRVQLVIEGGASTCIKRVEFPPPSGRLCPCRDDGGGEIALGRAMLKRAKRDSHIDPPASSYAIMRRACMPLPRREP